MPEQNSETAVGTRLFLVRKWTPWRGKYERVLRVSSREVATLTVSEPGHSSCQTNVWSRSDLFGVVDCEGSLWLQMQLAPLCGIGPARHLHIEAASLDEKCALLRALRSADEPLFFQPPAANLDLSRPLTANTGLSLSASPKSGLDAPARAELAPVACGETVAGRGNLEGATADAIVSELPTEMEPEAIRTPGAAAAASTAVSQPNIALDAQAQASTPGADDGSWGIQACACNARSRAAALEDAIQAEQEAPTPQRVFQRRALPLGLLQEAEALARGEHLNSSNSGIPREELLITKEGVCGWECIPARADKRKTFPHTCMELQESMRAEREHRRDAEAKARSLLRRHSSDTPLLFGGGENASWPASRPGSLSGSMPGSHAGSRAPSTPSTPDKKAAARALAALMPPPPTPPAHSARRLAPRAAHALVGGVAHTHPGVDTCKISEVA